MSDIGTEIANSTDKDGQTVITGAWDFNGNEIILDADGDSSITADTDDQIDVKLGGSDVASFTTTSITTTGTFNPSGGTSVADAAAVGYTSANGLEMTGQGSTYDWVVKNDAGTIVLAVQTGTQSLDVSSNITNSDGRLVITNSASEIVTDINATNASYASGVLSINVTRAGNSAYNFGNWYSGVASDQEFQFSGDGNGTCDGSWTGGGADYAEYFEWADGNPDSEDRVGLSVSLVGEKIKVAEDGETVIGVISAAPAVIGDGDSNRWKDKYLKDDFGRTVFESYSQVEWVEVLQEEIEDVWELQTILDDGGKIILNKNGKPVYKKVLVKPGQARKVKKHTYQSDFIPDGVVVPDDAQTISTDENGDPLMRRKLNPAWSEQPYESRKDRKEWDAVGLVGKLRVRKGQVLGASWIKMRDISDTVEEYLIK